MFICRQQLLRAFKPRQTLYHNASLRYVRTLAPTLPTHTDVRPGGPPSDTPATASRAETDIISPNSPQSTVTSCSREKTSNLSDPSSRQTKNDLEKVVDATSLVVAHDSPTTTVAAPASNVLDRLRKRLERGDRKRVDKIVDSVLTMAVDHPADRNTLLQQTLQVLADSSPFTHRPAMLRILQALQAEDPSLKLPLVLLAQITDRFTTPHSEPSADAPALTILAPIITDYVLRIHADHGLILEPYTHSRALWLQFKLLVKLVETKQHKTALQALRQLVQYHVIPSSALADVELVGHDFDTIVRTILVRCCVSFGWPNRAAFLLNTSPPWGEHTPSSFASAVTAAIDSLVQDDVSFSSMKHATGLIARYYSFLRFPFPRHILQRFYDRAKRDRQDVLALAVYRLTREPAALANHGGSSPSGTILMWLLTRSHARHDVHTLRTLVDQVVKDNIDVSEVALGSFVRFAAECGMLSPARRLWERAVTSGFDLVLRDPSILTRLVSLAEARIRSRSQYLPEPQEDELHSRDAIPSGEVLTSLLTGDIQDPSALSTSDGPLTGDSADGEDESDHGASFNQEEIDEYRAFADSVITTFIQHNLPLRNATREQLNALARAYVIRGKYEQGMRVLQTVLDRGETHDIYDANVALSAVSVTDAAAGAKVIEEMTSRGLRPDAVSFGTVINHAGLQGDMDLVNKLIDRARHFGITQLDYKTTGKLIRLYVDPPAHGGLTRRERLQRVKKLIESLLDARFLPSSNMGLDCVDIALRAGDPVIAYDFWTLLVKSKVQWNDATQTKYRLRIAESIWWHLKRGSLEPTAAKDMLKDLGYISYASQIPRASVGEPAATQEVADRTAQHSRRATHSKGTEQ